MRTFQPFPNMLLLLSLTEGWRTHRPLSSNSFVSISACGSGRSGRVGSEMRSEMAEALCGSDRCDLARAARGRPSPDGRGGRGLPPDEPRLRLLSLYDAPETLRLHDTVLSVPQRLCASPHLGLPAAGWALPWLAVAMLTYDGRTQSLVGVSS